MALNIELFYIISRKLSLCGLFLDHPVDVVPLYATRGRAELQL